MRALIRSTDWRIRPGALTRYFGGQAETAELEGLLDQVRIVTLTGAPGWGKTRLAVEFAALVLATSRVPLGLSGEQIWASDHGVGHRSVRPVA